MKSTKKKAVTRNGKVYAQGTIWDIEKLKEYRKYQNEYNKQKYRPFIIRFNKEKDDDIIKHLESQDNLVEYLRNLIRDDI